MESEKVKEIKKVLSCSAGDFYAEPIDCKLCKFSDKGIYSKCKGWKLAKDSLTLINELEKENEWLTLERDVLVGKKIAERPKTKESIIAPIYALPNVESPEIMLKLGEKNLVQQFAERLKEKLEESNCINNGLWLVDTQVLIDETLKECLCDNNQ